MESALVSFSVIRTDVLQPTDFFDSSNKKSIAWFERVEIQADTR